MPKLEKSLHPDIYVTIDGEIPPADILPKVQSNSNLDAAPDPSSYFPNVFAECAEKPILT